MSQFAAAKNPPWVRTGVTATANLVQSTPPGGPTMLTAQQVTHASAAGAGLAAGSANPLATAAAVVAAQNQRAQQGPAVSAAFGTGLAAITLTQSALQQGAMLQQGIAIPASLAATTQVGNVNGIAIPASLAATTQVANVNSGMVVEIARLPQPGVALPTSLATTQVATVSYPAPRLLAQTTQFQQPPPHPHQTAMVQQAAAAAAAAVQQQQSPQQQQQFKQRVFTGTVTKLHENFGFVDEDVFFQMSAVKGNIPKAGERVLVEATYNPSRPFKWNATRIQVLPNQVVQLNVQQGNNNRSALAQQNPMAAAVMSSPVSVGINVPQAVNFSPAMTNMAANQNAFASVGTPNRWQMQQDLSVMETIGQQQRINMQHNRMDNQHPWLQEMDYGEMMDKGPRLSNLPRRHSPPPIPRRDRERRGEERRERYRERERYSPPPPRKRSRSPRRPSRSPPRRRVRVIPRYTVQVPKISLDLKTGNVMELRKRYSNLYIPSDFCAASFLWQEAFPPHRPFSMDHQCSFHIVGKEAEPVLPSSASPDPTDCDYSFSAKVMLMSTPSLNEIFRKSCALAQDAEDAKDSFVHPTRLISFLVGLKGKNETVAIGGPWSPSLDGPDPDKDPCTLVKTAIRTCKSLTGIDLSNCSQWYRFAEIYYRRGESTHKGRALPTRVETVVLFVPDVWSCLPTRVEWDGLLAGCKKQDGTTNEAPADDQEELDGVEEDCKKEPTHFSELDPKTIKVNALKHELEARNLSVKGLKSQLIARLTKALKTESEKEAGEALSEHNGDAVEADRQDESEEGKKKEKDEEKKTKEDKEKAGEKHNLPEMPTIIVQPSRTAKNGKFDCTVMSLSVLLDYRQGDNKEHSFEVSLFAELFNEMMMRDFGFRIYRSLVEAPENKEDEKEKKKYDKKDDKKERKDEKDDYRRKDDVENDSDYDDSDEDENDTEEKRDRKKRRKKKPQMYTQDPYLLLSYIYYDQTHCGYLLEKDLEEIFYTLGLQLSRAQVRKLIQKVCKREMMRYRKLTDKPVPEGEKIPKSVVETTKLNLEELAVGNKKYIPVFKASKLEGEKNVDEGMSVGLVSCEGALVDVRKLMEQLERSEKARLDADEKLKKLQQQFEDVNEAVVTKEKHSQKLSFELDEQKHKLRSTEEDLRKSQQITDRLGKALNTVKDQLQVTMATVECTLKTKSRPSGMVRNSDAMIVKKEPSSDNGNNILRNKDKLEGNSTADQLQVTLATVESTLKTKSRPFGTVRNSDAVMVKKEPISDYGNNSRNNDTLECNSTRDSSDESSAGRMVMSNSSSDLSIKNGKEKTTVVDKKVPSYDNGNNNSRNKDKLEGNSTKDSSDESSTGHMVMSNSSSELSIENGKKTTAMMETD